MTATSRCAAVLLLAVVLSACSILPYGTNANTQLTSATKPTRATTRISLADLPNGVFVGVAMSGGGSRAANFSAAVLFELDHLGFLQTASALSSVSGSSLIAAYYGLVGHDAREWRPETARKLFLTNFESRWIARWFLPHNIVRYWLTDFDRSDIMEAVFDDVLFHRKQFGDMPGGGPKILMNATSLTMRRRFVFTDEAFRELGSALDTYPISHAVMASGAFPGAFHDVTLRNYKQKRYEHLFDGGPADNLGVETLLEIAETLYLDLPAGRQLHCFLFIVDAQPRELERGERASRERDTRKAFDFIVDDNIADAGDVLLAGRREDVLRRIGFPRAYIGVEPYQEFPLNPDIEDGPRCSAWHITFESLYRLGADRVGNLVNQIKTRYQLTGPAGHTAQELQDLLFEAAGILVRQDVANLRKACRWFRNRGFTDLRCLGE